MPESSFSYAELSMDWGRDRLERPRDERSQLFDSVRDVDLIPSMTCIHNNMVNNRNYMWMVYI